MINIKGTLPQIVSQIGVLIGREKNLDRIYACDLKEHREKRSIDANGYYWLLLGRFADWARKSKIELHNEMLAHYGQVETFNDRCVYVVIPDTDAYQHHSSVHLRPTSEVKRGKDGIEYRTFMLLRGSHTYTSMEMSILIDGLIQEIHGSGAPIQTMTPQELEKLKGYGYDVSEKAEGEKV